MSADDILRPPGEACDLIDIQGRGVRGQDGARLHRGIQGLENGFLHRHVFENRLDHDIGLGQVRVGERGLDEPHALLDLLLSHAALAGGVLVVASNRGQAAIERLLLHFKQGHRNTGIDEVHGDPAAHRAGPDDGGRFDRALRGVFRHIGDLAGCALGKECMAQGL